MRFESLHPQSWWIDSMKRGFCGSQLQSKRDGSLPLRSKRGRTWNVRFSGMSCAIWITKKLCEDVLQQNWITCIVPWSMWRTNRKLPYFFEVKWDLFLRLFQTVRFVWRYFQRHCWKHQCNYPSWVVSVRYWQCRCWWWRFAKAIGSSGRLHCWSILAGYATDPNKNGTVGESFRVVQLLKMFLPRYGIFLVRSQAKHPWESET